MDKPLELRNDFGGNAKRGPSEDMQKRIEQSAQKLQDDEKRNAERLRKKAQEDV